MALDWLTVWDLRLAQRCPLYPAPLCALVRVPTFRTNPSDATHYSETSVHVYFQRSAWHGIFRWNKVTEWSSWKATTTRRHTELTLYSPVVTSSITSFNTQQDTQARSRNQCCRGKAINITYSMCGLSSTQSACVVLYCHLSPVWLHHTFPR